MFLANRKYISLLQIKHRSNLDQKSSVTITIYTNHYD